MDVKVFNNVTNIVRDDMATTIGKGSKVSIAAACFSMYAYKELKKQLESIDILPSGQASFYYFTCLPRREHITERRVSFFAVNKKLLT